MRNVSLCVFFLCCLFFCGCIDQTGREIPEVTGIIPEPLPPSLPGTLVMNLTTGTLGPTPVDSITYPGTTGSTYPFPPVMNEGNPLTLVINTATVRIRNATIEVPEIAESKLLVLNVTIRNVQADPYDLRQSSIRVVDSDNRELRPFFGRMPGEQEFGYGQILHDQSQSGTIAFEVPSQTDRHYMIYIYDDRKHEPLCISLFQATEV